MNDANQMVRAPRELLEQALDAAAAVGMQDVADELDRILTPRAEQHPGEFAALSRHGGDLNFQLLQLAERSCSLLEDWVQVANVQDGDLADQIYEEGWSIKHDDSETQGELAAAAATYALKSIGMTEFESETWPWDHEYLKPGEPRRMLIKAGALILAELDRLDRQVAREARSNEKGTAQ